MNFRHHRSIRRPRFPVRVQNFGDLATFSGDFCILYSECPPYFYFRFVWPTDLESIPHASTPTLIIPTKFEVDMTIHCRVTAFLSAGRHVTWWPWPLTFWPWTVVIHSGSRDQPWHQVCLSVLHLWLITFPVGYHWECVRGHCECAESRDPWVGAQKQLHF